MPQIAQQAFSPRTIGETVLFSIDFGQNLLQNETISTSVWTVKLVAGSDSNPSGRVSGGAAISGTVSSQLIDFTTGPGTIAANNRYILTASVTTNLGETILSWGDVSIVAES